MNKLKTALTVVFGLALACLTTLPLALLLNAPQGFAATVSYLSVMLSVTASLFLVFFLFKGDIQTQALYHNKRDGALAVAIFPVAAIVAKGSWMPLLKAVQGWLPL